MMALDDDTLREIADSVCLPLLGLSTELGPSRARTPPAARGELHGARIAIEGAWQGAVELACPGALLDRVAGAMFDRPVGDIDATDRQETLLELANLFGGTVKGLVPGPSRLGLPEGVAPDVDDAVTLAVGGETLFVSVLGFEVDDEP